MIIYPKSFTVRDLIALLSEFPLDAEVHFADPRFGGQLRGYNVSEKIFQPVEVPAQLLIHFPADIA